jgi:hypothetical protein
MCGQSRRASSGKKVGRDLSRFFVGDYYPQKRAHKLLYNSIKTQVEIKGVKEKDRNP